MTYGEGGKLGFSVTARNIVDGVHSGGAAEKGGLKEGDLLIAVNGAQLIRGLRLVSVLPKGGQGTAVTLFVVRPMVPTPQQPEQSEPQEQQLGQRGERRKRARPDRLGGSTSLEGVRLGAGHIQRLAGIFAGQTGDSL
jgi:predicted metalloprotease with PDZ domain